MYKEVLVDEPKIINEFMDFNNAYDLITEKLQEWSDAFNFDVAKSGPGYNHLYYILFYS
ncbi:hypothetical protein BH23BAC1_BH23BAC1_20190 [soil metagenome]